MMFVIVVHVSAGVRVYGPYPTRREAELASTGLFGSAVSGATRWTVQEVEELP